MPKIKLMGVMSNPKTQNSREDIEVEILKFYRLIIIVFIISIRLMVAT